jgi:hypothetical protein
MPQAPVQEAPWFAAPGGTADDWRLWAGVDYLEGWVQSDRLPVLVTTATPGTTRDVAGIVGNPSTDVLFGGTTVNQRSRPGVLLDGGYWLDGGRNYAIEARAFVLDGQSTGFNASSNGSPILARPFIDATAARPESLVVAFPGPGTGSSTGSIQAVEASRNFWGGSIDLRGNISATPSWRLDALLGYAFFRFDEHLTVQSTINPTAAPFVLGTSTVATDFFGTRNIFNGLDLGLQGEVQYQGWWLEMLAKVAVGSLSRHVTIDGTQVVTVPGTAPVTSTGGLLALSSNIGKFGDRTGTGVPELGLTLGYQVRENVRVGVGYSVLWFLNVARPGEQVDPIINPGLIPPNTPAPGSPNRPMFTNQFNDIWVQAVHFRVEVRY